MFLGSILGSSYFLKLPCRDSCHANAHKESHQEQTVIARKVKEATATLSPNMLRQLQKALLDFGCLDARCAHVGILHVGWALGESFSARASCIRRWRPCSPGHSPCEICFKFADRLVYRQGLRFRLLLVLLLLLAGVLLPTAAVTTRTITNEN